MMILYIWRFSNQVIACYYFPFILFPSALELVSYIMIITFNDTVEGQGFETKLLDFSIKNTEESAIIFVR